MDDKAVVLILPVKWHGTSRPKRITAPPVDLSMEDSDEKKRERPRKIIELDGSSRDLWRFDREALHLWDGHLWSWDDVGCTFCIDDADQGEHEHESTTLCRKDDDGQEHFHCLRHGKLDSVPCTAFKEFTITVGDEVKEGEVEYVDAYLIPASQAETERGEYIKRLVGELVAYQESEGAFPSESDIRKAEEDAKRTKPTDSDPTDSE